MKLPLRAFLDIYFDFRRYILAEFGYRHIRACSQPLTYWYLRRLYSRSRAYQVISDPHESRIDFFTRQIKDESGQPLQVYLALVTIALIDPEYGQPKPMHRAFWRYGPTPHVFDATHNWVDCVSAPDEVLHRSCRRSLNPNAHYVSQILTGKLSSRLSLVRALRAWVGLRAY